MWSTVNTSKAAATEPLLRMSTHSEEPLSIDTLLGLAGGFGRHQWRQSALNAGCNGVAAISLLLPVFLYPRLRITEAATAIVDSLFFVGNTIGLIFWGGVGDACGRRPVTNLSLALLIAASATCFSFTPTVVALALSRVAMGFAVGAVLGLLKTRITTDTN